MSKQPHWLEICQHNLIPLLEHTSASLFERVDLDASVRITPILASYHLHQSVLSSVDANEKGHYSVAMALLRQCVEALTIVEIGLQSPDFATDMLHSWAEKRSTQGQLRKRLEVETWPRYGCGLWQETWAEYFGNLARAVQPYAHYSHELMGWQLTMPAIVSAPEADEPMFMYANFGLNIKDLLRGARISLFVTLVAWTVARLLGENGISCPMQGRELTEWGESIAASELLDGATSSWADVFLPHLWFYNHDFRL